MKVAASLLSAKLSFFICSPGLRFTMKMKRRGVFFGIPMHLKRPHQRNNWVYPESVRVAKWYLAGVLGWDS